MLKIISAFILLTLSFAHAKSVCTIPEESMAFVENIVYESIVVSDPILDSSLNELGISLAFLGTDYEHINRSKPFVCSEAGSVKSFCLDDDMWKGRKACLALGCTGANSYHSAIWYSPAPFSYPVELSTMPEAKISYLSSPRMDAYHDFSNPDVRKVSWQRNDSVKVRVGTKSLDLSHKVQGAGEITRNGMKSSIRIEFKKLSPLPVTATTSIGDHHQIKGEIREGQELIGEFTFYDNFAMTWKCPQS